VIPVFSPIQGNMTMQPPISSTFPSVEMLRIQALSEKNNISIKKPATSLRSTLDVSTTNIPKEPTSPTTRSSTKSIEEFSFSPLPTGKLLRSHFQDNIPNQSTPAAANTRPLDFRYSSVTQSTSSSISSVGSVPSTIIPATTQSSVNMDTDDDYEAPPKRSRHHQPQEDAESFAERMKTRLLNSVQPYSSVDSSPPSTERIGNFMNSDSSRGSSQLSSFAPSDGSSRQSLQSNRPSSPDHDQEMNDVPVVITDTTTTHKPQFNFLNALDGLRSSDSSRSSSNIVSNPSTIQPPQQQQQRSDNNSEPSQFQTQFIRNTIEDVMISYRSSIHEDVRNLHLDMLRQFHLHSDQTNQLIINLMSQVKELSEQLNCLTEENRRLKYLHSPE
jgi:hypothetical protein